VVIDGSGDRAFKQQFKTYLIKHIAKGCVRSFELKDSKRDALLQLADMCAGAIARSYRTDRREPSRWRNVLRRSGQIHNLWAFK
jgi:hypothetical protein